MSICGENENELFELMKEDGFLREAKKLYGMDIEPRGKEIYFLLKEVPKNKVWKEVYQKYLKYIKTEQWRKDWVEFKLKHKLTKMIECSRKQ